MVKHIKATCSAINQEVAMLTILEFPDIENFGTGLHSGAGYMKQFKLCFRHGKVILIRSGKVTNNYFEIKNSGHCNITKFEEATHYLFFNRSQPACNIPAKDWPEIKAAIEAYNEYFADGRLE